MSSDPSITIVGLGPGNPTARTRSSQDALDAASVIVLRTAVHPGLGDLVNDQRVVACDDIYESAESFNSAYAAIADRVIGHTRAGSVVYAVPGSAAFGERSVQMILEWSQDSGVPVRVIPSVSALDEVALAAGIDLLTDQPQLIDGLDLITRVGAEPFSGGQVHIDTSRPMIISQVFNRHTASVVKHALVRAWPETHPVVIVRGAGTEDAVIDVMPLSELDHVEHDHLTTLVLRPLPWLEAARSPVTLFRIIGMLRSPDGCPWDREQSHASLADKVIEEAHEVAEAIASGDPDQLRGELGDLLLLVALCAQIAEESGDFAIEEVFHAVSTKLVRRHPHVFGDAVAETPEEVLSTWKRVKAAERGEESGQVASLRYDQLPRTMSVIERIRRSEGDVRTGADDLSSDLGSQLLVLVERCLTAGIDPDAALEREYRTARQAALP